MTATKTKYREWIKKRYGSIHQEETEEKYAITWTSKKEQIFEMPTSGAAIESRVTLRRST